jgi:hypothetical protein
MVPVFPDVSVDDPVAIAHGMVGVYRLVIPDVTDSDALIAAYEADPHIEYAERSQPFEAE